MLLRCWCDAEDLNLSMEDRQRHGWGGQEGIRLCCRVRVSSGSSPQRCRSSASPLVDSLHGGNILLRSQLGTLRCPRKGLHWVPAQHREGMHLLLCPCPAIHVHVPNKTLWVRQANSKP